MGEVVEMRDDQIAEMVIRSLTWHCEAYFNIFKPHRNNGIVVCLDIDRDKCGRLLGFPDECNCVCHARAMGKSRDEWLVGEFFHEK